MATKSLACDFKQDKILVVSIHPGWVKTDMGGKNAPMQVTESCRDICILLKHLDEKHNGVFIQHDGTILDW